MLARDSSPFRRPICEPLLECRRVEHGAKTVTDAVRRQIDVHVPLERRVIEPFENFHSRVLERQRHLERKVTADVEQHTKNITGTLVKWQSLPSPLVLTSILECPNPVLRGELGYGHFWSTFWTQGLG
jgi:hypothetical protein